MSQARKTTPPTPEECEQERQRQLYLAARALAIAGVRHIEIDGRPAIGVWSDLDQPSLRAAIREFYGPEHARVVYLDSAEVPARFKERRVPGEPIPLEVLLAMLAAKEKPWLVRDRLLKEMGWLAKPISWKQWEAKLRGSPR